jgi:hypothetical protein
VFSSSGGVNAGYDGGGTHFAMDNFTYSALPEPDATIAAGGSFQVGSSSADAVLFSASTGTLVLDNPFSFSGKIAGISGSGDVLDLKGLDTGATATTGSGSYDAASGTTTLTVIDPSQHLSIPITLVGDYSNSTWTVTDDGHGGVDIADPPAISSPTNTSGASVQIASGASLEIANPVAVGESVTFPSSRGGLTLDAPSSFTGIISGFTGDGTLAGSDQIDLKGINYHSSTFSESFNAATDTLAVGDGTDQATLRFSGVYQAANFSFASDGDGGTIVYDPPVSSSPDGTAGAYHGNVHGFVFKFASDDRGAALDHADAHPWGGPMAANGPATFDATQDDSHGRSAGDPEGHDPVAWPGILKAQLHANDFHFV